jgi:5-formyltetrahydrofolate cyclo-ligase
VSKDPLRNAVWDDLEESGEARFPFPPHGRIPNFAGADDAAGRLTETDEWVAAETVKANPDAPQLPVRRAALRDGKTVFVAVPRLTEPEPFLRLDPAELAPEKVDDATTVSGISEYGTPVAPEEMPHVDLIVSGSVLVTPEGDRIGKGEGYSDLEFAVLTGLDAADDATTVATTIHEMQVRAADGEAADDGEAAADEGLFDAHDVPMDVVCTPERTLRPREGAESDRGRRPDGIDWDVLGEEKLAEIPVLERLREERD